MDEFLRENKDFRVKDKSTGKTLFEVERVDNHKLFYREYIGIIFTKMEYSLDNGILNIDLFLNNNFVAKVTIFINDGYEVEAK